MLRISPSYARDRLELVQTLTTRLPSPLQALWNGKTDEYTAGRMAAATGVLTDDQVAQVEEQLVPDVGQWNPQQLDARLRRAVARVDPEAADARRAARQIRPQVLEDGAGVLQIYADAERTHLTYRRVQTIARELKPVGTSANKRSTHRSKFTGILRAMVDTRYFAQRMLLTEQTARARVHAYAAEMGWRVALDEGEFKQENFRVNFEVAPGVFLHYVEDFTSRQRYFCVSSPPRSQLTG